MGGSTRRGIVAVIAGSLLLAACASSTDPDPTSSPTAGGTAVCDEPTISAVIRQEVDETYPGATFVSLEDLECVDGWAAARALVDTSGVEVTTAFYLRAEGQFWIPTSIEEICSTPLEDSGTPAEIYERACGVQD